MSVKVDFLKAFDDETNDEAVNVNMAVVIIIIIITIIYKN